MLATFPLVKTATASLILFKGNANDDECDGVATDDNGNASGDDINWEHSFTRPGPQVQIGFQASIVFRLCPNLFSNPHSFGLAMHS